ncbi:MAG: RNA-binding cell elongation regulator Jag/EloR [Eubacteriales bacterium]
MKTVEVIGKTVEEAVQNGLSQLDLTIDEAHIDILDGGGKGVLGLLGVKMARVRVSEKQNTSNRAVSFLAHVADLMGSPDPGIAVAEDLDNLKIKMEGENLGNMIGHRGETLEALQLLTGLIVNHHNGETEDDYVRVKLDIGGYRKKREETLTRLAHKLAQKAKRTGKNVQLEPMNSYERRIIHTALSEETGITTHSHGLGANRRVVISIENK